MPPATGHPFSLRYIYLSAFFAFFRSFVGSIQWISLNITRRQKLKDGVVCKRIYIPSRDKGRDIKVDLYQPAGYDGTKRIPVLINLHGSGFTIPSLGTDREFCGLVASQNKILVFDSDYRKAPKHPFPCASQDAEDVFYYLSAHPDKYDTSNIFLSGFSAGGNLALTTAAYLGPEKIKGVVGVYPSVDLTKSFTAPEKKFVAGVTLPPWLRKLFYEAYIPAGESRANPRLSAAFAPTDAFPNHVLLACGNADDLYNPCEDFVKKLKGAGHPDAEFIGLEFENHGFDKGAKDGTETAEKKDRVYNAAVDLINRALGD